LTKLNKPLLFILIVLTGISCGCGNGGGGGSNTTIITLVSIAVTPKNISLDSGTTAQLTATGTYSDNTTQDITTSVIWSSSNTAVATISNTTGSNGLATALFTGTTTITASSGGISGLTLLTVALDEVDDNVLKVTVNGSLCSTGSYPNKPCVSVTVCSPGTSNCKTINDILLDTGSTGLRIFKSILTDIPLTPVASGSGTLASCMQYADGTANWGSVQMADIILGNEPAVTVPIQIIDSTFGTTYGQIQSLCGNPETTPQEAGYNGILGVGLFTEDCGSACATYSSNGIYYSCSNSTCAATVVPLSEQVQNPVPHLPIDNNGVIITLPAVALGGITAVDGNLILGIGTRSNNTASGVTTYPADPSYGEFITVFNNITYNDSFIDSGTNAILFNKSAIDDLLICNYWYCPLSTLNLTAATKGFDGYPSDTILFQIGNALSLLSSSKNVFIEIGAPDKSFIWGLPFFFGRSVYVGFEGKASSLGTGPYWAY
jgi:hypothetical protein